MQELVQKYGIGNWRKISAEMGNYGRSPNACDLHWYLVLSKNASKFDDNLPRVDKSGEVIVTSGTKRRKWTDVDDQNLLHLASEHGVHPQSWGLISQALFRTELAVRWRYNQLIQRNNAEMPGSLTSSNQDGTTSSNADNTYIQHMLLNQSDARKATSGSSSKRRRWTLREDEMLQQLIESRGSDSWAVIASKLDTGRSHDACQYHWQYELCPKLVVQQQIQLASADKRGIETTSSTSSNGVGDSVNTNSSANNEGEIGEGELYLQQSGSLTTTAFRASEPVSISKHVGVLAAHTYSSNSRSNEWYKWTPAEDNLLRQLIDTYGCSGQTAWERIAAQMPGRTLNSVRMRWKQALRPAVVAECLMGDNRSGNNTNNNVNNAATSNNAVASNHNELGLLAGLSNNNQTNFAHYSSLTTSTMTGAEEMQAHGSYSAINTSAYV